MSDFDFVSIFTCKPEDPIDHGALMRRNGRVQEKQGGGAGFGGGVCW